MDYKVFITTLQILFLSLFFFFFNFWRRNHIASSRGLVPRTSNPVVKSSAPSRWRASDHYFVA
ncbi:hypothetical protein NC651_026617 [Populus alba x Populus x berolinensis]|nr:hypothetical protein NC651_026617 [Populus alba x Populus x berolinensis]